MTVSLVEVPAAGLGPWIEATTREFTDALIQSGESPAAARKRAEDSLARLFPDGHLADLHCVFDAVDDGEVVGRIWLGPAFGDDETAWWVWDVAIERGSRGRGYGRATMLLAEDEARARGATSIGLNVFGSNAVARHLYESLGYETMSLQLRKNI
jgi:ribosomal protein S18 acetylase RimI-like enzyme